VKKHFKEFKTTGRKEKVKKKVKNKKQQEKKLKEQLTKGKGNTKKYFQVSNHSTKQNPFPTPRFENSQHELVKKTFSGF
jgi:hypothetical protein